MSRPQLHVILLGVRTLAVASFVIGFIGLTGYLTGSPTLLTWGQAVSMALPTSLGIMANAAAIYVLARSVEALGEALNITRLP